MVSATREKSGRGKNRIDDEKCEDVDCTAWREVDNTLSTIPVAELLTIEG